MNLSGRVAIVTGSSRGIGKSIALELAARGANIVLSGRNKESLDKVSKEIIEKGPDVLAVAGDVGNASDAQNLIDSALEKFGKIDILINNAGITRDNLLLRMSEEDWDIVLKTNLKGAYNCIRSITKPYMKQRNGVIINITSVIGQVGNAGQVNYAASKAGVIGLTKSVAKELSGRNIRVNAVAPGFIETEMTENLPQQVKDELLKSIPLAKLGQPEDVAKLVSFLVSDDAAYITGQVINVDGGMVM
ncbi:MAG: 3-oxoacyl-[acyl-carrier-protein] reductase [Calditrichaceae bacterium]